MDQPYTNYSIVVDEESEEVYIEAWDDEAPGDIRRARLYVADLAAFFRRIDRALTRS